MSSSAQTISIALCTFNGALYLQEQLDSMASQSRLPDELVVCDDGSSDGTIEILRRFSLNAPFPVRIVQNPLKLGIVKNFELAIRSCACGLIALADQDDIWLPTKLERIAQEFAASDVMAVFSDAEVVDASLKSLGYTLWEAIGFNGHEQARMESKGGLDILLRHSVVMGAALVFRADLRTALLPIPSKWNHDRWAALIAANAGSIVSIKYPLLLYRQHGNNQVGGRKKSIRSQVKQALSIDRNDYYKNEIAQWKLLSDRLTQFPGSKETSIQEKIYYLETCANLPNSRIMRLPGVLTALARGQYARFSRNWGSIALDLLIK